MTLPVDRFLLNRQGWVQSGAAALLAVCSYGVWIYPGGADTLGRWVGIGFLLLLGAYLWMSIRWGREHTRREHQRINNDPQLGDAEKIKILSKAAQDPWSRLIPFFFVGLFLIIFCGRVVICCAQEGAKQAGVPEVIIAGTIVALGTSLPELMVGITAIRKGHPAMLIGNVVGADVLNILFVIGASAAATPLHLLKPGAAIPEIFLYLHLPTMLLVLVLFRVYIFDAIRKGQFRRWQGVPLLFIYAAYLLMNVILAK